MHTIADTRSFASRPGCGRLGGAYRHALLRAIVLAAMGTMLAGAAAAAQDPNRTATIYVLGFDASGAARHGIYGADLHESLADSVAAFAGLPTSRDSLGPLPANVVAGTDYYGDVAPFYYTAQDVIDLDQVTSQWGGGVPRYAMIVAKYARRVLERSGADQVNFLSSSFGSLIVRWLIEKDVEGLAGDRRIGRWLTVEGVVAGNWAASHDELVTLLGLFQPTPIDLEHMSYDWIEANLHAPRGEAADPAYGSILIGEVGSTDDTTYGGDLRDAMLAYGEYQPNDGVQGLLDAGFRSMTSTARFATLPPTIAVFHSGHVGLKTRRNAWAEAATFLTASRRVRVTMTAASVLKLHEPQLPYWNWTPAEVLFESRVYSPAAQARWGVVDPLSAWVKEGAALPLRRYGTAGETQQFQQVVFDDLVLPEETQLRLDLHAVEVDYDLRYGIVETAQTPYYDDMGGGTVLVSTLEPGTYTLANADWNCALAVTTFDYGFPPLASPLGVSGPRPGVGQALAISPNPFRSRVRLVAPLSAREEPGARGTLEIADVSGRIVRHLSGRVQDGFEWDGRDDDGRPLPAGVYLHRIVTDRGVWHGRSCLLR